MNVIEIERVDKECFSLVYEREISYLRTNFFPFSRSLKINFHPNHSVYLSHLNFMERVNFLYFLVEDYCGK